MKRIFLISLVTFCATFTFAQSPEAWAVYEKARHHYNGENYSAAIPHLEETVKRSPDFYNAYQLMANCYHQLGDVENALVNYEKIIDKKELDEKAWYNIGLLYVRDKQHGKGLEAFNKALEIKPNYQKAAFQIGLLENPPMNPALRTATHLYKQRKYKEGLDETYNIKEADVDADVFYWRGNFLKKLNKKPEAIEQYKVAIGFDEQHGEAHTQLGVLYFRRKNYEASYEHLAKASDLNPDDQELMHDAGISAYYLERYEETIEWLVKYLGQNPEGRAAHYRLAAAYSETGDDRALEHLRIAADLDYPMAVRRMEEGFNEYKKIDYSSSNESVSVNRGRSNNNSQTSTAADKKMTKKELKAVKKRAKKARKAAKKAS